jgi:hypothetical protein
VPKRRPSSSKIEARAPTPPPRAPTADEPEIEEIVEMEAEPPPTIPVAATDADSGEVEMTVEMEAGDPTLELAAVDAEHEEMSVSVDDDGARVTETVRDTSSQTLTVTVEEDVPLEPSNADNGVVSGTIKIPKDKSRPRSKRASEGWED